MRQGDPREELRERAEADGIEFFLAMFVDLHGKPCAKAVPISAFDLLMDGGAGFAGYAAGDLGQSPADPDISPCPDPASYTPLPWKPGVAVLHCDPQVEGKPWPYAPRVILRRLLDELAETRGWTFKTGMELEYRLLRRAADGTLEFADPHDTRHKPCYEVKGLTRMWDHLSDGVAEPQQARVGQLRQRPRGRQRPVREQLALLRRADHRGPHRSSSAT